MSSRNFTVEECNLICIYSATDRQQAIDGLYHSIPFQFDNEIVGMTYRVVRKLKSMTNEEFLGLNLMMTDE